MNDYNWEERNIITFDRPEDVALYTNDLHVWYGTNEAIKGIDLQFEKQNYRIDWTFWLWEIDLSSFIESHERWYCEYESNGSNYVQGCRCQYERSRCL